MKIQDVLRHKGHDVKTVSCVAGIGMIAQLFSRLDFTAVIVIDTGRRPLGIVTVREIIRAIADHCEDALKFTAADVMETPVPVCSPDDDLRHAMGVMTRRRIRHLLVKEDDVLFGIVSIGDLVQAMIQDAEMENRVLRDMAHAKMTVA
ncbi:MAG: CBS domain-containing protein [Hyphomicrobiaceae bacterium]|nr:CBS domain-containing protein [Hyphomicrobiaceae bacterium]